MNCKVYCIGMGIRAFQIDNCSEFKNKVFLSLSNIEKKSSKDYDWINQDISFSAAMHKNDRDNLYTDMAFSACDEALKNAGISQRECFKNKRIGMVIGSSLGDMALFEAYCKSQERLLEADQADLMKDSFLLHSLCNKLADYLKIRGPCLTITNTCVSGLNAVGAAADLIADGIVDICIAGGVDVLSEFIVSGMESLNALSKKTVFQPFAIDRDGIILGEGAGFIVLANEETVTFKNCTAHAIVKGYSITNDAVNVTAPDRYAEGLTAAIIQCLMETSISAKDIDCVFTGGTGTKYNDDMQALAIKKVWRDRHPHIPITSVKPLVGHTLGASGIIECIGIMIMIKENTIYPIGEKYKLDMAADHLFFPFDQIEKEINNALLLGAGFSGVNGALIIGKV